MTYDSWDDVETRVIVEPRKRGWAGFMPLPSMDTIKKAALLPGKAPLVLFLLARYRANTQGARGRYPVTLPSKLLEEFGINPATKSRGLKLLEKAGLLKLVREPGMSVQIKLPAKARAKSKG
jgi:hypothetical protein